MANFKDYIAIPLFFLSALSSFGQKAGATYLIAFSDSSSGGKLWGFKSTSGQIVIKPKYNFVLGNDTLYNIAFVTLNYKWVVINKQDSIILTPHIFDNGPDYVQEGLFRFDEKDKMGFANLKGEKVIPATFDFASPFSGGLSAFSVGGKMRKRDEEHSVWDGGLWGFINKKGQVIIKPKFINTYDFVGATCEVWTQDNKHILIDKKGNTVKIFRK